MGISIREVKETDAAEIVRLSSQLGYPTTMNLVLENIRELLKDPEYVVFVAQVDNGTLAGFFHVLIARRVFHDHRAELGGMIVDQDYRGKGIGRSLLKESERWAVSINCQNLCVRSNITRKGAKEFYLPRDIMKRKSSGYS